MEKLKLFSREQVGNAPLTGRQYSRPDSLSLVSRQSVLAFLLVLLTTVFGVGNVWGETYSMTPNAATTGSSSTSYWSSLTEFTHNEIGWKMAYLNPSTLQTKTNQSSATSEFRFYNTTAFPGRITKVVITYKALTVSTGKASEFKFLGGTSEVTATTGGDAATWDADAKTMTWTPADDSNFTFFAYYMNGKTATGNNYLAESDAIVVTYETGGGDTPSTPTCATPTFSPAAGSYEGTQNVTISSTTGATIYYTTDGSNPSTSSSVYSSPIAVSASQTIKAYAVKEDYEDSEVAEAAYVITEGPDVTIDLLDEGWGFPTSKVINETSYTNGSYTIKVAGTSGNGFRTYGTYFLLGQSGAYIELPVFTSPIAKIVVAGNSNGSGIVAWNVFQDENAVSTAAFGCKSDAYTFDIATANQKANVAHSIKVTSAANLQIKNIKIYFGEAAAVEAPTISGETPFVGSTEVTITAEGADAIYYTLDGTDPTANSTKYTAAFTLEATKTVKAIAVKGSDVSAVASKEFTKVVSYTTIADIYAKAVEVQGTATDIYVTFGGWKVSGKTNSNAFVTDGTNGLIIYASGHGFNVGDALTGTVACKVQLYKGSAELTTITSSTIGLTVTSGSMSAPVVKTIDALSAINTGALVTIENLTFDGTDLSDGTNTIKPYTSLFSYSMESGKKYNVTGVFDYFDTKQILPRSIADIVEVVEAGAPEAPTFSVEGGTYTSAQTVELSCATEGAKIYYTTDGTTPTSGSTEYTTAISVGENMTIKAIAVKDEKESTLASATYVINLPEDVETSKTWDLSIDETATASTSELTWTSTYVNMSFTKGTSTTNTNNYYPGTEGQSYTSTRAYKNSVITITPNDKQITSVVFTASTSGYATTLKNAAWTNATATANDVTVTVIPTDGEQAISATLGGTTGFTAVRVNYTAIDLTKPATPTFSPAAGEYTSVQSVELSCVTDGAKIYYTTDGTTPTDESTEYTTAAISVGENMTIKAIAIKDDKSSSVAEAVYIINLPANPETTQTWDLTIDETATASADELTWTATYVAMSVTSGTAAANNYYPGTQGKSYEETRIYNGATLTITPKGKQITSIVFETNSSTPFKNATWTNGEFSNSGNTVMITVSAPGAVVAEFQANTTVYSVTINYGPIDESFPVAPTFSVEGGTYTSAQIVELSCATEGAKIYYTTDGTNPTSESTEYTAAITVDADKTIKAVAINGEKVGPMATAAYKINLPLTTMDAILTKATAIGSTADEVLITFDNWVISGVGTDKKTVYVTDGTKGFVIYGSDHGFAENDKLSGTVACNLKLYSKVAEVVDLKASADGLTVSKDGVVTPVDANIADLGAVNIGAPIILNSVKFDGTNFTDGTNTIKPYDILFAYEALTENKYYNVKGIYVHYNDTKEIAPRSVDDIEEIQDANAPTMAWYTSSSKEVAIGASYVVRIGDTFAPYFETNSSGELTYSSSDETVAQISASGELTLKNKVGTTVITCAVAADDDYLADSKSFTLQVKAAATVENVVFVAQFNDGEADKWLAMKHDLNAMEVNYSDGKIWDLSTEAQAAITWVRTDDGENVTFQNPENNNYLKGSTGSTMTVAAGETGHYNWHWENDGYYTTLKSGTLRTPLYQGNTGAFKYYAVSNAGTASSGGYSELPQVVAAVFATTPVEPEYEVVRQNLTAGNYYTVCYNKTMTEIRGASLWSFAGKDASMAYLVEAVKPYAAGTPYFIYAESDKLEAVVEEVTNPEAGINNGLYGTFENLSNVELLAKGATYMLYQNALHPIGAGHLDAFRAYVILEDIQGGAPSAAQVQGRRVRQMPLQGQTATGLGELNASETPVKMVINGQLFILCGEKMYDVTGKLVK